MSDTTTRKFELGDLVTAGPGFSATTRGVVYKITKVPAGARGVNYTAMPKDDPTGKGIRGPADALVPFDPDAPAPNPADRFAAVMEDLALVPEAGVVVKVTGIPKINPDHLYVVLGHARQPGNAKIVRLGGDGGRYWPRIPAKALTVVDTEPLDGLL